jgi:hypothetical protein
VLCSGFVVVSALTPMDSATQTLSLGASPSSTSTTSADQNSALATLANHIAVWYDFSGLGQFFTVIVIAVALALLTITVMAFVVYYTFHTKNCSVRRSPAV